MPDAPDESGRFPLRRTRPATAPGGTTQKVRIVRAPGFVLTSRAGRDVAHLTVSGELTMVTATLLDAELAHLYGPDDGTPDLQDLLVDLTDVTFLDVMGLASLRRVQERAVRQGRVRLGLPASTRPRRLLTLAVDSGWIPDVFLPGSPFGPAT
jgi:ABC-type transporter Mla MlaB component